MDLEQIVNDLIALFAEHEIEVFRAHGDVPAMVLVPDALGEHEDKAVRMYVSPIYIDEELMRFQCFTIVAKGIDPMRAPEFIHNLNEINKNTTCGAYILLQDDGIIAHRQIVCASADSYADALVLAINDVLTAIDSDISTLSEM